jgi:GAF domain-containing protein
VDLLPPAWLYPAVTSAVLTLRQPPRASIASKTFRAAVAASPFRTMIGLECPPSPLPQTLSMPVHCERVCVGTIDMHVHVPQPDAPGGQGPFLPEEIKLLTRVADKIGEYLTRAAQHDALLEREKELACLHRLANCFIGAGDRGLRKFFKVVVHELQQSFQFPSVCDAQIVFGGK